MIRPPLSTTHLFPFFVAACSAAAPPIDPTVKWASVLANPNNFAGTEEYLRLSDTLGPRRDTGMCATSEGRKSAIDGALLHAGFVRDTQARYIPRADFQECVAYRREFPCRTAAVAVRARVPDGFLAKDACSITDGVRVCQTSSPAPHAECQFVTEAWAARWAGPTANQRGSKPVTDDAYGAEVSRIVYGAGEHDPWHDGP